MGEERGAKKALETHRRLRDDRRALPLSLGRGERDTPSPKEKVIAPSEKTSRWPEGERILNGRLLHFQKKSVSPRGPLRKRSSSSKGRGGSEKVYSWSGT